MKEIELFQPVKIWLEQKGCLVKAEVKDIDVLASLSEELFIAVELKLSMNLQVILQAFERSQYVALTYIAIPMNQWHPKKMRSIQRLLKHLGIGLLLVYHQDYVVEKWPPRQMAHQVSKKSKQLMQEFNARVTSVNIGGQHKMPIITAYRERCLLAAHYASLHQVISVAQLRSYGIADATTLMNKNYYGWFQRVARGQYELTADGRSALKNYEQIVTYLLSYKK